MERRNNKNLMLLPQFTWQLISGDIGRAVISPDFSLELTGFFQGKHLIHFFGAQDEGFLEFRSR